MKLVRPIAHVLILVSLLVTCGGLLHAEQKRTSKKRRAGSSRRAPAVASWPTFESRHSEWARRREAAANMGAELPDALEQYLVSEVLVTGIFHTEESPGVFLYAKPTGNTFFATSGSRLYNGRLLTISGLGGYAEDIAVVFVELAGKRGVERQVIKRIESAPSAAPAP